MKTTLELPDDLIRDIKLLAVHEGKKLKDAVAELLRRGLETLDSGAGTVVKADPAMLKRRKVLTKKFVTGDWGLALTDFEAGREADRAAAEGRANSWRN